MKVKVISPFNDRYDLSIRHNIGDILDWDDQNRINDCVNRGLVEAVPEKVTKPKTPRKPKTTK